MEAPLFCDQHTTFQLVRSLQLRFCKFLRWKEVALQAYREHSRMAEHLASIFGTEKDRVNCPFYFKIG